MNFFIGNSIQIILLAVATRATLPVDHIAFQLLKKYNLFLGQLKWSPVGQNSNPEGSYGAYYFPEEAAVPDHTFCQCVQDNDKSISNYCKPLSPNSQPKYSSETQCGGSFVLGPSDAVIAIITKLPPARYFSIQTNVNARFSRNSSEGVWYPQVAPGDAINQISADLSWNESVAIVSTADAITAADISTTLSTHLKVVLEPLNATAFRFWNGGNWTKELPDLVRTLGRYSVPLNSTQLPEGFALLVRAKHETNFLEVPPLRPRVDTGNTTEIDATANLNELSAAVVSQLADHFNCTQIEPTITMIDTNIDDPTPLLTGMLAENFTSVHYTTRDAYYANAGSKPHSKIIPLHDIVVALGAASTSLSKSVFDNLAVSNENITCFNDLSRLACTPTHDDRTYPGSAAVFLPSSSSTYNASASFAVAWSRREELCAPWVTAAPAACILLDTTLFPKNSNVSALYRAYLNPISHVGAGPSDMIPPRILSFRC